MNKYITPMQILEELHDLNDRFGEMGFPVSVFVNGDRYPVQSIDTFYNYDDKRKRTGVHSMDINAEVKVMLNSFPTSQHSLIEAAKKVLTDAGYYVDNLWHIEDVTSRYKCDDTTAMAMLDSALTHSWIVEKINETIDEMANEDEIERKDDDE